MQSSSRLSLKTAILFLMTAFGLAAISAFGESAVAPVAAAPAVGTGVLAWLGNLASSIPTGGAIATVGAVVLELLLRVVKTEKPRSVFYFARDASMFLGQIFHSLGSLLDGILQNSVNPSNPPPKV